MLHEYTGRYPRIVPTLSVDDGISAVRAILPNCEFDAGPCAEGLKTLRAYRKDWDEERGCWRDKPRHDWASHGADAFRVLATRFREYEPTPPVAKKIDKAEAVLMGNPDGSIWGMSANRREKKISAEPFVGRDCSYPRPRPNKNSTKATIRTTPSMPIPPPVP